MTDDIGKFCRMVAGELTRNSDGDYEDAVQEGMIAAWVAEEKHPGKKPAYYRVAAKRGIIGSLSGRRSFGSEGRRGWRDAHGATFPNDDGEGGVLVEPACQDSYPSEYADVRRAVAGLPEEWRQIVFDRYWLDLSPSTFSDPARKQRLWGNHIRPTLREELRRYTERTAA